MALVRLSVVSRHIAVVDLRRHRRRCFDAKDSLSIGDAEHRGFDVLEFGSVARRKLAHAVYLQRGESA